MSNIQVTHNVDLNNARSESSLIINPNNPLQMVSGSKKFNDLHNYDFVLATQYSEDGGLSWHDSAALATLGFTLLTDPAIAWDDAGNVFLVGLSGNNPPTFDSYGIEVYKSTDGGKTWSMPNHIHTSPGDDKQWAAGDTDPGSPFHGRVYAVWDDGSSMRFARTLDHGGSWIGTAGNSAGSVLVPNSFAPEINVASDGTIYIVWGGGTEIYMIVSSDGGDSFHAVTSPATGIHPLGAPLPTIHGWTVLPGGTFRVLTLPTACVSGQTVVVAWADLRENNISRIYYALSYDGGASWDTGPSGQPLLSGNLPADQHHFHPQVVIDSYGVIGCAFYEFGPKAGHNAIDVLMAQSLDGGASFTHFVVTDQPWDPAVDAPWVHHTDGTPIDGSATFIGDYFGLDASGTKFHPLWTDTRTGIQELWTAIVPERRCTFLVERSTFGQDEIDARRSQPHGSPGGLPVANAFHVVVDGFTAGQLGLTGSGSTLDVASPVAGMTIHCTGNTADNGDYGSEIQRFTFHYDIDFPDDSAFTFPEETKLVTLVVTVQGLQASAQVELIKQPNPFILHGDPPWLSIDLRVFVVHAGEAKFGVPMGSDASGAPTFIQQALAALNLPGSTVRGEFDNLPTDESARLFVFPSEFPFGGGRKVFNFAIAKVHYIGQIGAHNVRVFFRLFQAQTTSGAFDYPPGAQYRRATNNPNGHPIPLAGFQGTEYITIPCFAAPRIDSTALGMDCQVDNPYNVQDFTATNNNEVDHYFGCWLDINQPTKPDGSPNNVLPVVVETMLPDGPFTDPQNPPLPIQQSILRNLHQCLIAEIAFDPVEIPPGKDPGNWDKLAQRNLAWSDIGSAQALTTFEIRPTPAVLPPGKAPDELMIDWGHLPADRTAQIYLPGVKASDVLKLAARMYASHRLMRVDDHTLQCRTGGLIYIPIPPGGSANHAGLLTIDIPDQIRKPRAFTVVVRQVTNASARIVRSREIQAVARGSDALSLDWRRVLGAFQLNILAKAKQELLIPEERQLSLLRWIYAAIPMGNRWQPVFQRYLVRVADRVRAFGGNPDLITSSATGDGIPRAIADVGCRLLAWLVIAGFGLLVPVLGLVPAAPAILAPGVAVLLIAVVTIWQSRCKPDLCSSTWVVLMGVAAGLGILALALLAGFTGPAATLIMGLAGLAVFGLALVAAARGCQTPFNNS